MLTFVVDDDPVICAILEDRLRRLDWTVCVEHSGRGLLQRMRKMEPQAVLLDLHLGGENGIDVVRQIRRISDVPILMLTGVAAKDATIACLEAGADDYIIKPSDIDVLEARMRAAIRSRTGHGAGSGRMAPEPMRFGDLTLDVVGRDLHCNGARVALSATEIELLEILLREHPKIATRGYCSRVLLRRDWEVGDRAIDLMVSRLRRKLDQAGSAVSVLTIRGEGYRIAL